MNSQDFLTLNLAGAGIFVLWYVLSRGGGPRPTQLDMKAPDSAPSLLEPEETPPTAPVKSTGYTPKRPLRTQSKNLNIIFNYNGHAWDAHEVLGVPAGASLPIVTEAYQTALRRCDKESIEFHETAYKAILNSSATSLKKDS